MLIPGMPAPDIELTAEYSEAEDSVVLIIQYGGEPFNVLEQGDELSLAVLNSVAADMSYSWQEDNVRGNRIVIRIRS